MRIVQSSTYQGATGVLVSDAISLSSVVEVKLDAGCVLMTRMYCLEPVEGE